MAVEEPQPGRYRIRIGFVDIGQGSRTALKAMAADALETDLDHIEMIMSDTAETLDCGSAAGSRSTFIAGNALLAAVKEFKTKLDNKIMQLEKAYPAGQDVAVTLTVDPSLVGTYNARYGTVALHLSV